VIARATPAHKVRIVKALQRAGRVVGMTGDGANDASAIRLADVGIALGERSTLAARDAADLIVVDERIETIVDAIAEGRAMWSSVRDAVAILTGGNLGEIGFAVPPACSAAPPSLNARQLLLVNLLTDVAPTMAIALRPPSEAACATSSPRGPRRPSARPRPRHRSERSPPPRRGCGLDRCQAAPWRRRGAPTVALLALVGTQLGQTLVAGQRTPAVWPPASAPRPDARLVETPGVSHVFGCRPHRPARPRRRLRRQRPRHRRLCHRPASGGPGSCPKSQAHQDPPSATRTGVNTCPGAPSPA
jgi:cation-transporting ATPase I